MDSTDASTGLLSKVSPQLAQTAAWCSDPLKKLPRSAVFGHPVVQDDMFNAQASNITIRKRAFPQVPHSPAQPAPMLSSLSPCRFEDQMTGLFSFAESAFGIDLKPVIIAHDKETQVLLDRHQISWGTQYELARGVSLGTWTWEEVKEKFRYLTGDNAHAASQVQTVMRGKPMASENPSDFYLW